MTSFTKITFAAFLMLVAPGFVGAASAQSGQPVAGFSQCITDDGNGRTRPCEALRQEPSAGNQCITDDGNGRTRPCEALRTAE